jgi:pimeloyl-ACP methyl ester carboxylesterase
MRVWMDGMDRRKTGEPVVILESGGQAPLEMWRPVFEQISKVSPVFAYDRPGTGQSEFDGEQPTFEHIAQTLHALLEAARIPPPYVLAGASWGGVYVRGFASLFPKEVAGLVYLDATDVDSTLAERATFLPSPSVPARPQLPDTLPAGQRAALLQLWEYVAADFAPIRALNVPSVPVAVLVSGVPPGALPPDALTTNVNIQRLMQIRHQAEWALSSPAGLMVVSSTAGHNVVQEAPDLVLQVIKHVLDHAKPR